MRIWSCHPRYLDRQALIACWRETLLAQKVLAGETRGYAKHPQLERFRAAPDAAAAIGEYLSHLVVEARQRGYHFDVTRIRQPAAWLSDGAETAAIPRIEVSDGQLAFERSHLLAKLRARSLERVAEVESVRNLDAHPLFTVVDGPIASWERAGDPVPQKSTHT